MKRILERILTIIMCISIILPGYIVPFVDTTVFAEEVSYGDVREYDYGIIKIEIKKGETVTIKQVYSEIPTIMEGLVISTIDNQNYSITGTEIGTYNLGELTIEVKETTKYENLPKPKSIDELEEITRISNGEKIVIDITEISEDIYFYNYGVCSKEYITYVGGKKYMIITAQEVGATSFKINGVEYYIYVDIEEYLDNLISEIPNEVNSAEIFNMINNTKAYCTISYDETNTVECVYRFTDSSGNSNIIKRNKTVTYNPTYYGNGKGIYINEYYTVGDIHLFIYYNDKEVTDYYNYTIESSDTSILNPNNNDYTAKAYREGKVKLTVTNKNTLESKTFDVTVTDNNQTPSTPDIENQYNSFKESVKEIGNKTYDIDMSEDKQEFIKALVQEKANIYNVKFKNFFLFDHGDGKYTATLNIKQGNEHITIDNIKFKEIGVIAQNWYQVHKNQEIEYIYLFRESNIEETATHSFDYDPDKVQIEDDRITFKTLGKTSITVTITGSKTYTATLEIDVLPSYEDIYKYQEKIRKETEVTVPISRLESNNNLDVVAMMIKDKYLNDIKDTDLYGHVGIDVSLMLPDYAYVTINIVGESTIILKRKVNYSNALTSYLSNVKTLNNNVEKLNNLSFADTNKILSVCGTDDACIKSVLESKIASNTDYQVELNLKNTSGYKDITNHYYYDMTVTKDSILMMKKEIDVLFNVSITFDRKSKVSLETFIANQYKNEFNKVVSVTPYPFNVFKIEDNGITYYNYLNLTNSIKATSLWIKDNKIELKAGATKKIELSIYPKQASIMPSHTYKSDNESVAKVSSDGVITAVSKGYANIKLSTANSESNSVVLVDMTVQEFMNEIIDKYKNIEIKISPDHINRYGMESAISQGFRDYIYSHNLNLYSLSSETTKSNDKYYTFLSTYTNGGEIYSKNIELKYEIEGIGADEVEYSINTGDKVNTHLYFTEGDNSNLYINTYGTSASMNKDGIITGIETGVTYFYINDIYNKYYYDIKVIVDEEKLITNATNSLKNDTFKVDIGEVYYQSERDDFDYFVRWRLESQIDRLGVSIYDILDCNSVSAKVYDDFVRFTDTNNGKTIDVKYELVGIETEYKLHIDVGDTYYTDYESKGTKPVKIISSDPSIVKVTSEGLVGVKPGITTVKYTDGDYTTNQFVVVNLDKIIDNVKDKIDSKGDVINIPTSKYDEDKVYLYGSTDNEMYRESYYVAIESFVNETYNSKLLGDYIVYPSFSLGDIETIKGEDYITINYSLNYRYLNDKYQTYFEENIMDSYGSGSGFYGSGSDSGFYGSGSGSGSGYNNQSVIRKRYKLVYSEDATPEEENLGIEIMKIINRNYSLDFTQTMRYILNDRKDMYKFSSVNDELHNICSDCTLMYSPRMGDGDVGYEMNGGMGYIIKNNHIIASIPELKFESRTKLKTDKIIKDTTELYKVIKEEVITSYDKVMNENKKSSLLNIFGIVSVSADDTPKVSIDREYNGELREYIYNIKVNDIEMHTIIETEIDGNVGYNIPVTGINVGKTTIELKETETTKLNVSIEPKNATDKNVTYTGYDSNIVSVSNTGVVTGKKVGTTSITITSVDGGFTKKVNVTVKPKEIKTTSINFVTTYYNVAMGLCINTSVSINPSNHTDNISITYSSSNSNIATVDGNGNIYTKAPGVAYITATSSNGLSSVATVSVYDPTPANSAQRFTVTGLKNKTYTGRALKQSLKVYMNGKRLKVNKDYKISYSSNKSVGLAYVHIKGIKKYQGTKVISFIIKPKKTSIKRPKAYKGGSIKVAWTKQSGASGYQIEYGPYKKEKKYIDVPGYISSYSFNGNTKKTKYTVRVRTYVDINGQRIYGSWSTVKKIKAK